MELDTSNYGVYEVTRNDTGEVIYIGCAYKQTVKDRLKQHIRELKGNYHVNSGLQKLWNAKGLTFTHVVSCLPIKKLILAFEKAYGAQYDFKKLMNVKPLGQEPPNTSGENSWWKKLSPEEYDKECKKVSERMKGPRPHMRGENNPAYGKPGYWAGKKRPDVSEMMTGEGNPQYGKTGEDSPNYGKKPSEETIEKLKRPRPSMQGVEPWNKGIEWPEMRGQNHPNSKITNTGAWTIKFLLKYTNYTHLEISYRVPNATKKIVDHISVGTTWKDLVI